MILLFTHVTIAIVSLVVTTLAALFPSHRKIRASGGLIGLTLISGTVLVVVTHQPILHSCLTGLVYLSVAMVGVVIGHRRLARESIDS